MQSLLQLISGVHRSWIFFDAENSVGLGETNDPERLLALNAKWTANGLRGKRCSSSK
jgi:hypothetical protein